MSMYAAVLVCLMNGITGLAMDGSRLSKILSIANLICAAIGIVLLIIKRKQE